MMTIVDYGLGNVRAFTNLFKRLNVPARAARTAAELNGATRLILPGVGAFDHAMEQLDASGLRPALEVLVQEQRVPVLGVCVGMQMLAHGSDEGRLPGLGWLAGRVRAFRSQPAAATLPMPHMGWNDVHPVAPGGLFSGLADALAEQARFYFLHSFYFECAEPADEAARAHYGLDFACAVQRGHVCGVQFHPEKSHHWGERLLANFARG
ncbi:MAG: imidazole glycerol phosphate synthase subunit HisH [Burkholderiales bacterium]|nr:imidazole glycerol phosphate synthase subunit HisH [Burkholderiales bacterium]